MTLVIVGGVMTANAWNYLKASFNSWADANREYCLDRGPVAVYLTESETAYQFGIMVDGNWKGPNNNDNISETTTINDFSANGSFNLNASVTGYYVFSLTWNGENPTLVVRYPDTKVYFYNALNWENVYLHAAWWNGDKGASNRNNLRGVQMTSEGNGIYSANIPLASLSGCHFTFTKDQQVNFDDDNDDGYGHGYGNFYNTEVVWNGDISFDASTPLYVPSTTVGNENLNGCKYYYGITLHAYPTYSRTVTDGNYGTICLPFNATVEGATVYKITGKVMKSGSLQGINIDPVTSLEAGKAYIYKAAGTTITATLTGNYSDATAGYGMMGNVSSEKVTISSGYVIKDNKIRKLNGGTAKIGQYKGYITLDGIDEAVQSPSFIGVEETTGIDNIEIESNTNAIYDLQGHRVTHMKKGIYIINGKKIQVK